MKTTLYLLIFLLCYTLAHANTTPRDSAIQIPVAQCRWGNCGEYCPSGFTQIQQGNTRFWMVDHSHCKNSVRQFCCPIDAPLPVCRWRGRLSSGHCIPGCEEGETTVGSHKIGCSANHQSACCKHTSSIDSYRNCQWRSCSAPQTCSGERFKTPLFSASAGFGGDKPCSRGVKTYCCDSIPRAFTNCKWYNQLEAPHDRAGKCDSSCPKGQVQLALQRGTCKTGESAYCCSGQPGEDPDTLLEAKSFQQDLDLYEDYINNGNCDKKEWPEFHSRSVASPKGRRGLQLSGRADCARSGQIVKKILTMAIKLLNLRFHAKKSPLLESLWDHIMRIRFRQPLSIADLDDYLRRHPLDDREYVLRVILYSPRLWGDRMRFIKKFETEICIPWLGTKGEGATLVSDFVGNTSTNSSLSLLPKNMSPRAIQASLDSQVADIPSLGRILMGINRHHLTLAFARWVWYQDLAGSGRLQGPMLQLTYWIGRNPGQPTDSEFNHVLNMYRDVRPNTGGSSQKPDIFVVMHLHMDASGNSGQLFVQHPDGTYVGITSLNVRHSKSGKQKVTGKAHTFDVKTKKASEKIYCPGGSNFPIGPDPRRLLPKAGPEYDEMVQWFKSLYEDGYLGRPGLEPILAYPTYTPNGDIRPDSLYNNGPYSYEAFKPRLTWSDSKERWPQDPWGYAFRIIGGTKVNPVYDTDLTHLKQNYGLQDSSSEDEEQDDSGSSTTDEGSEDFWDTSSLYNETSSNSTANSSEADGAAANMADLAITDDAPNDDNTTNTPEDVTVSNIPVDMPSNGTTAETAAEQSAEAENIAANPA
ncbi:hypothetical protein BDV95DRAFT_669032 [Massariosphaeria phaeospora]|uniref:Uncharacterized protein n=1 Tax=Massariosphaeria phaeospora TaxID=100035 RepID=A0A7C8I3N5_9PLEO|nr:hypothetical protein BDV95DRAFT_669032 [Massariosphaeria phaeospora]